LNSRKAKAVVVGLASVGLVAALAACSPQGSTPEATVTPTAGGVLRVGLGPGVTCVDPQQTFNFNASAIARAVTDSLVDQDPATGEITPWLLESWEINDTATEYTLHLRDGVTFSDGSPLTAQVLADNFNYIKNTLGARSLRGASYLSDYVGTKVEDDLTAVVTFSKGASPFLVGMSTLVFSPLSESTIAKTPDERCQGAIVGTGPFVLDKFAVDQSAVVTKREGYDWASKIAAHSGDAYLDSIEFTSLPVPNVRAGALTSGQIDVALTLESQDVATVKASGASVDVGASPGMGATIILNPLVPGLDELEVRQAITMAIDRKAVSKNVMAGLYPAATSFLSANLREHAAQPGVVFDPDAAGKLLDKAGWVKGADGIRVKNGQRLEMSISYSTDFGAFYDSLGQLLQQQLKDVGIAVTLDNLPQGPFIAKSQQHAYQSSFGTLTESDPDVVRGILASSYPDPKGAAALGVFDLFDQERGTSDQDKRNEIFGQIQKLLVGNGLFVPVFDLVQLTGSAANVEGVRYDFKTVVSFYDTFLPAS
jgi:peptide/nickel transport system substrate-binding protein